MNASLIAKLEQLSMRLEEVGVMLSDPDVASVSVLLILDCPFCLL
jgi:hypothetical protein